MNISNDQKKEILESKSFVRFCDSNHCSDCVFNRNSIDECADAYYAVKMEELKNENARLNDFCAEFIFGEENPKEHDTEINRLTKKIEAEKAKVEKLKNIVKLSVDRINYHMDAVGAFEIEKALKEIEG